MSGKKLKKSLRKVSRFGLIFFILFFAMNAFFVVFVQAVKEDGKCGNANGNTYDDYYTLGSSGQCDSGTLSNRSSSEESSTKTKWTWECAGKDGGTTATGCYAFTGYDSGGSGDTGGGDASGDTTTTDSSDDTTGTTTTGDGDNTESGGGTTKTVEYDNPLNTDNIIDVVERVADYFYYVAIAIVPIITIYAAVLFLTAAGNESQVGKARKTFIWLIIGIAILLIGSGVITLLKDILNVN